MQQKARMLEEPDFKHRPQFQILLCQKSADVLDGF